MESIEQMIKRLCPGGVKYVKLGDCLEYEQPTKYQVYSKEYLDNGIGKPHPLTGDLDNLFGISLNKNYRLIVEPLTEMLDDEV